MPLVVAFVGGFYACHNTQERIQAQFVSTAIEILREPPPSSPSTETTPPLRTWAIEVMDEYSPVDLTVNQKEALRTEGLPGPSWGDFERTWRELEPAE